MIFIQKHFLTRKRTTIAKKLKDIKKVMNIFQSRQFVDILKRLMSLLIIEIGI